MRFAFCNEGFGDTPWEWVCSAIAEAGYQGVEIAPFTFSDDIRTLGMRERAEIKRSADRAGIEVVGLHWLLAKTSLHIAHPDRTVREATSEYLRALAGFCADLGGQLMVFGSPKQRGGTAGATQQQAWEWAKEVFAGVFPALAERGVILCIEPLSPTDPEGTKDTDFINTAAEARRFVEEIDHPNMRLLLDVRSMCATGTVVALPGGTGETGRPMGEKRARRRGAARQHRASTRPCLTS